MIPSKGIRLKDHLSWSIREMTLSKDVPRSTSYYVESMLDPTELEQAFTNFQ
jgi:hypothetical protein